MERLARGFQMSLRRRLERSKLFAEPILAEFASYERCFYSNSTVSILQHEAVAESPVTINALSGSRPTRHRN